jgi:outer membrane protein TolC
MVPMRDRSALNQGVAPALLCCLLAGCSSGLDRPSDDLLPSLSARQMAVGPEDNLTWATGPAAEITSPPGPAPVGDRQVQLASFTADAVRPIPLAEAILFALQNNPRLRAALAAIDRARGQEAVAFAPFLPQIDLLNRVVATGKSTLPGSPGPTGVVNVTGIGDYEIWQSEMQLQWTLYDFGRTRGRYGQARLREKIAELQALRAQETVAFDVATAYLQALEAAAFRRIAVETVRRAEAVLEDVKARREGGVALRDDVLRGQVQLSESRDGLVRADDAEITAVARLNNAMGRDASLPLRPADGLSPGKLVAPLADCLDRAASQRPEVGVARDRVAVAQFGRLAARGEFLPSLGMKGSLGRIEGHNVVGGWSEGVGLQLNLPLYRGGANLGNLASAEADIRQALADGQGVLNDITLEVTVAHRGAVSAQTRVELARPAVEQSAEALRIVRRRYRAGTATPTDVIDAETARTRSEQRYASARIEYLLALARLAYVMGDDPGALCLPLTGPSPEGAAPPEPPATLPAPRRAPDKMPMGWRKEEGPSGSSPKVPRLGVTSISAFWSP